MIRPQPRELIGNKDIISRHLSQITIRKTSTHAHTPREEEPEFRVKNIQKSATLKLKKPSGIENLQPNSKRLSSSRYLNLPMKMQTQVTQVSHNTSIENKIPREFSVIENDTKLTLLSKAQIELVEEVSGLICESVPKLPSCQNVFDLLNKNINLAYKSEGRVSHQLEKMLDQYVNSICALFNKVITHSSDYVDSIKCTNLINKIVELEKENTRIMDLHLIQKSQLYRRKMRESLQNGECVSFKEIDYEKILINNYQIHFGKPNEKSLQELSNSLVQPFLNVESERKVGAFEAAKTVLESLIQEKSGQNILCRTIREMKNNSETLSIYLAPETSEEVSSLSEDLIIDILKFHFNPKLLDVIKNNIRFHLRFGSLKHKNAKESKISIEEIITLLFKASLISCKNQESKIILGLISKCQLNNRAHLKESESKLVERYLQLSTDFFCPQNESPSNETKNKSLVESKLNRFSSKRLVNGISMFENKKSRTKSLSKYLQELKSDNSNHNCLEFVKHTYLSLEEASLCLYFYLSQQIQYIHHSVFTHFTINKETCSFESINLILEKIINKNLKESIQKCDQQEKKAIALLVENLTKNYENIFKEELGSLGLKEVLKILEEEILEFVGKCVETEVEVLGELKLENNNVNEFI